jgi:K+-transporting ATPase ATPase C chain
MRAVLSYLRTASAALRVLLVLTVVLGIAYPLLITAVAQVPGLQHRADGSLITRQGQVVGSSLIGQSFTGSSGDPLVQYFQSRPSAAGSGYDPTASGASNLGPESIIDGPTPSLLTQVCTRSLAIGGLDGVDGSRPFCTADGVGAVLVVFWSGPGYGGTITGVVSVNQGCPAVPFVASYRGVAVACAQAGTDHARGQAVPIRGDAPANPAVPSDAVTASGSGLDPDISPAYARIQERRVASARHVGVAQVAALVAKYSGGRGLGFLGEPTVNVLELNLALDHLYPYRS